MSDNEILEDIFGPQAQAEYEAFDKARKLRRQRPWVRDIIRVLWGASQTGLSMDRLVDNLWEMRKPSGLNMPRAFRKTVQSFLNQHTAQSSQWNRRIEDDLFYSPKGKGSGVWAIHRDRANAWLKARRLPSA
jgi:hypothetical protein